ncbi:MAG: PHP domain-containing protein, partial [Clostridia bacterium]|nr:PHP domain-containing protein [Clostridia bacterium]
MHVHTYYSDGAQSPADVIAAARRAGVGLVSVTDHDNANACGEVKKLAVASGIIAVDGEEVSAYDNNIKVHILGYGMDCESEKYVRFHRALYDGAEERTFDVLKKLSAAGVRLSYGEVVRERKSSLSPLHGMHIATAGARKGYARSPF